MEIRCKSKVGMAEGAASAGREQPRPGAGWSWLRRLAAAEEAAVAEVVMDREAVSRKSPAMGGCLL